MAFWRKQTHTDSLLLAHAYGETLSVTRVVREDTPIPHVRLLQQALVPLSSLHTAHLLRERLTKREHEPVVLFQKSPLLYGDAVNIVLPRYEEGYGGIRDTRELQQRAHWHARDEVREKAATFFGCTLEDVQPHPPLRQSWKDSSTSAAANIFQFVHPTWSAAGSGTEHDHLFPSAKKLFLPLLVGQTVGQGAMPEAVLHIEEDHTIFLVRRFGMFSTIRSIGFGARLLRQHLEEAFECSPHEASLLLHLSLAELPVDRRKALTRVLRRLLPLWAGAFHLFGSDLSDEDRPERLLVSGVFPAVVASLYCRPQFLARCMQPPFRVEALPQEKGEDDPGMKATLLRAAHALLHAPIATERHLSSSSHTVRLATASPSLNEYAIH